MSRRVAVVLLCEDKQHLVFFERVLKNLRYVRKIRTFVAPSGEGSAEQYVRRQYPDQVQGIRRSHYACCLVVATDADRYTMQQRLAQLEASLVESGKPQRSKDDPIAIFIPKWQIETWIRYLLSSDPVSEDEPLPRLSGPGKECHPAADRFAEHVIHKSIPDGCPPSLTIGLRDEAPRIPETSD